MLMRTSHIPTVADLAADPITHHYDDMIAPAGLTNHLGTVRVDHDLTSVTAVQFPPVSQGLATTAVAFVDGRIFKSYGAPVTHEWRADRVVRRAELPGLELETTTVVVPGQTAVAIDVRVRNTGAEDRSVEVMLSLAARVVSGDDGVEHGRVAGREERGIRRRFAPRVRRRRRDGVERAGGRRPRDRAPERCRAGIRGVLGRRRRHGPRRRRDRRAGCRRRR